VGLPSDLRNQGISTTKDEFWAASLTCISVCRGGMRKPQFRLPREPQTFRMLRCSLVHGDASSRFHKRSSPMRRS
jgi:hypothetical protein